MDVEVIEIREFLTQHEPFDRLPDKLLDLLLGQLMTRYYRRGTTILSLGQSSDTVYVLRSGAVDIIDADGDLRDRREPGACFGSTPVLERAPMQYNIVAIEDSLVMLIPGDTFRSVVEQDAIFDEYFRLRQPARLHRAVQATRAADRGEPVLKTRLGDIVRRPPLHLPQTATIRQAAQAMSAAGTSSLLVMDGDLPVGIVTDRDLRNRVLATGLDPSQPISAIMTPDPVTAPADGLAFEALVEMVHRNIHHVPIMEGRDVVGVISSTDLMRLENANPIYLVGEIAKHDTVSGIVEASRRLPWAVEQLVSEDATADDVAQVVTGVGDAIERRLLSMAERDLGPPPVPYCWVVLGSQARLEQGLSSDQDNALILSDDALPEHDEYFSQLAAKVSNGLAQCGYPPCRGDVMATNPRWRQTLSQWRATFGEWVERPKPMAVMHSTIFFDMRPLHGDISLADSLRSSFLAATPHSKLFLVHMAKHAVARRPPIGFFREFVLESEGDHTDTLDLKRGGVGAVVELARVYALTLGMPEINTRARLEQTAAAKKLGSAQVDDLLDAFEFISYVRLRHQGRQVRDGEVPDNFVSPDELTNVERRHLRDVFQVVRKAQSVLAQTYPLQYVS